MARNSHFRRAFRIRMRRAPMRSRTGGAPITARRSIRRANLQAMRAQMPKKYWHNMPETDLIPGLLADAGARTQQMVEQVPSLPRRAKSPELAPQSISPDAGTIPALREQAKHCERCALYRNATQTVFGEGPPDAPLVFVGEQPGDQEDLAGK